MFEFFRDYIWYLLPSFFKRVKKGINQWWIFARVLGAWFDECLNDMERARDETTIATCSNIMLRYHGADRGLVQYTGETNDIFRSRIAMYDELMSMGGTSDAIVLAVRSLGYDNVEHVWIPALSGENERWAEFCMVIDEDIANAVPAPMENVIREVRFWKEPESRDSYMRRYTADVTQAEICSEALYEALTEIKSEHTADELADYLLQTENVITAGARSGYLAKIKVNIVEELSGVVLFDIKYWRTKTLDGSKVLDGTLQLDQQAGLVELYINDVLV